MSHLARNTFCARPAHCMAS